MKNVISAIAVVGVLVLLGCNRDNDVTFANPVPEARECTFDSDLVGASGNLRVSSLYGISGFVKVVSDCEIVVTDFNYNGLGPNVSFYAGIDGNYGEGVGVNMSEILNGQQWVNDTLHLFLPEEASTEEYNSFSVWCFEFDVDFSSVEL